MEVRKETYLPTTLESLRKAGFDRPFLFVDNSTDLIGYQSRFNLPTFARTLSFGNCGNWVLSAWTMWLLNPFADRYAIFEDDIILVNNLKEYLETTPYPENSYLNLITVPDNLKRSNGNLGWFKARQVGYSATALVFDNNAMKALLSSNSLINHTQDKTPSRCTPKERVGRCRIDKAISVAMRSVGITEYAHNPSLVYHIGKVSSMGNAGQFNGDSFPGEDFDLKTLIKS